MNKREIERKICIILMVLSTIFFINSANALVCITMSNGNEWNDAKLSLEKESYFSFRVYNSSADGRLCEDGTYEITAELIDSSSKIEDVFDVAVDSQSFDLINGQNKQILLTLTPKELGAYVVKVTTKLKPKGSGGTQMVYTTSAKINIAVSLEGDKSFNEMPFWKTRKDCPNGLVVKEGEECPRLCKDGTKAYESKKETCPEDVKPAKSIAALFGFEGKMEMAFWGGIGGAMAAVAILGLVAYKRKQEAQATDGVYNAEQN